MGVGRVCGYILRRDGQSAFISDTFHSLVSNSGVLAIAIVLRPRIFAVVVALLEKFSFHKVESLFRRPFGILCPVALVPEHSASGSRANIAVSISIRTDASFHTCIYFANLSLSVEGVFNSSSCSSSFSYINLPS